MVNYIQRRNDEHTLLELIILSRMLSIDSGSSSPNIDAGLGNCDESVEEPEDILFACLGVVYDYTPITHSEAGSVFSYTYPDARGLRSHFDDVLARPEDDGVNPSTSDPIKLTLHTPDTQAHNWDLHASSIWASSVYLADHIDELRLEDAVCIARDTGDCTCADHTFNILELGSGAGLPGLLVAKYLQRIRKACCASGQQTKRWAVTLSDYPDDLLIKNLCENVKQNGIDCESVSIDPSSARDGVHVAPYAWGDDISVLLPSYDGISAADGFHLILAADTLWNAALHTAFARTLYLLLRRTSQARVHLLAGLHTGRYALSGFLRTVRSLHCQWAEDIQEAEDNVPAPRLEVLEIKEREVNGDGERGWREDRDGEDEAGRRRWVVWITLGWQDV